VTIQKGSTDPEQANYNHLVIDIVWFGLALAATTRFLSLYAIRLDATPAQLSLLAALPGVALLLSTGLSGWWRRRYGDTIQAIRWPGLMFRLVFLLPAFAPFFPLEWQPIWLILAVSLTALPQGISGAIFIVLMREAVSENRLARLTSSRTLALNIAVGAGALAFGLLLESLPFPVNYQVMFLIAFLFTLISQWHVLNIRVLYPDSALPPEPSEGARPTVPGVGRIWQSRRFLAVAFVVLITHIAFFSIIMVTPLRLVDELGASEGFIALFGLAELIAGAMIATQTDRIARRIGARMMIVLSMVGTALASTIIAGAVTLETTLLAAAISGAAWTAASIGVFILFIERVPKETSTASAVGYQQVIAAGIFLGPMLGNALFDLRLSLIDILLVGAGLRLLAAVFTYYNVFDLAPPSAYDHPGSFRSALNVLYRRGRRR
jgi:predicted MFS family arabinose efflux permease